MRLTLAVVTVTLGINLLAGCGPAPQPVWNKDSHSFFYTQADGSVMQYDLEKEAIRTLLGPDDRQPMQISMNPKMPSIAIAATALGQEGRAAQLAFSSLLDGKVTWQKMETWGNASAKRGICPSSCYWCPTGQRLLIWYQKGGEIPDLIQSSTPFGRFAIYDVKSETLSELTTAPPAVIMGQAIHTSPLCPDGSGYLAMKLADNGPKFFFVSWDGWEYPLTVTKDVEALLNTIGDPNTPQEKRMQTCFPLPQGVWTENSLKFATRSGVVSIDVKSRKITLESLPENVRKVFDQITSIDAADAPWITLQTAAFKSGELELHYRMKSGTGGGAARVELVDTKLQRRRILLEGVCPENFLTHHLFPAPNGQRILVCLKDARTKGFCIHVVQADGTVFAKLDTGTIVAGRVPDSPKPPIAPERFDGQKAGELKELAGMKFHWCPPGSFMMGEGSPVEVTLSTGFWLGETEVTQGQWKSLMNSSPWSGKKYVKEGDSYAASYIIHSDPGSAVSFCHRLTERERNAGRLPKGWKYALPTEAQWEYACRAGTKTKYSFGDDELKLGEYAWFDKNAASVGDKFSHEVGLKKENPWGFRDMHGNVCEWCADWYHSKLLGGRDPRGPSTGSWELDRVIRGGDWSSSPECRSAYRYKRSPIHPPSYSIGFRVAAVPFRE